MLSLLKEAGESDSKNFFGQYSSKRMKEWSDIIKLYEKDNILLAEASHILISLINYDIPSFKKTIDLSNKQAQDLERKQNEWEKNLVSYQHKYQHSIQELGIQGIDVRNEISSLISQIHSLLVDVTSLAKDIKIATAIKYYEEFNKFTSITGDKDIDSNTILPTLKSIIKQDQSALLSNTNNNKDDNKEESPSSIEIDWTVIDDNQQQQEPSVESTIDWDITLDNTSADTSSSTNNAIVWDIEDNTNVIELVDSSIASLPENTNINVISTSTTDTLENIQTRTQFIDDILEVKYAKNN